MSSNKIPISQILDTFADVGVNRIVPKDFRDFAVSSIGHWETKVHDHSNTLGIDETFVITQFTADDSFLTLPQCGGVIYEDIPTKGRFYIIMNESKRPFYLRTTSGDYFQDNTSEIEIPDCACVMVVATSLKWYLIPILGMDGIGGGSSEGLISEDFRVARAMRLSQ